MLRVPAGKMGIPFILLDCLSVTDVQGNSSFFSGSLGGASYAATGVRFSVRFPKVLFFQLFFQERRLASQPVGLVV